MLGDRNDIGEGREHQVPNQNRGVPHPRLEERRLRDQGTEVGLDLLDVGIARGLCPSSVEGGAKSATGSSRHPRQGLDVRQALVEGGPSHGIGLGPRDHLVEICDNLQVGDRVGHGPRELSRKDVEPRDPGV